MSDPSSHLTREQILELLEEVGAILTGLGRTATIYVVGGAAMALEFETRRTTRDVDASIRSERSALTEAVAQVAERHRLPADWLNSQAAAFLPSMEDRKAAAIRLPGITVAVASAEHLIAMKLHASRRRDRDDLEVLFRHVGLSDPQQAADIYARLYDPATIGYLEPDEVLYEAMNVFARAEREGRPISRPAPP